MYENTFFALPPGWMLVVTAVVPLLAWGLVRALRPAPLALARSVVALSVLLPAALLAVSRPAYERLLYENGPIELWTAFVLLGTGLAALDGARAECRTPHRVALGALGLAFLLGGGEELSWGQNLFQWESPEFFSRWNQQRETNLHNITARIFHTKGLTILLLLAIGVILPALARRPGRHGPLWTVAVDLLPPPQTAPLFLVASILCLDLPTGLEAELGELIGAALLALTLPLRRGARALAAARVADERARRRVLSFVQSRAVRPGRRADERRRPRSRRDPSLADGLD